MAAEDRAVELANGLARHRAFMALAEAIARAHPQDACALMCAALDDLGAGSPEYAFTQERLRADAAWWADAAHPGEIEAHVMAGLRRMDRTPLGEKARKRLLVGLWETMPMDWRLSFLARVDPEGKLRRAA